MKETIEGLAFFLFLIFIVVASILCAIFFYDYCLIKWLTPNNTAGKIYLVLTGFEFGFLVFSTFVKLLNRLGMKEWLDS